MLLFQFIRSLDKKYALGLLLSVVLGAVAIYTDFFRESRPNLKYEVLSNTPVLDVREYVGALSILYAGNDINKNDQSLFVMTMRVVNDGRQDILKGSYDENDPPGFALTSGTIVESPELLTTSNDYLRRNLKLNLSSPQKVVFSNVIIESRESFVVKVLVLQDGIIRPDISPIGKVAGVKTITITYPYLENLEEPFWTLTFKGGLLIQVVRAVSYTLLSLLFIGMLGAIAKPVSDLFSKQNRIRLVEEFRKMSSTTFEAGDEFIFDSYINKGERELYDYESALLVGYRKEGEAAPSRPYFPRRDPDLVKGGLLKQTDAGIVVNENVRKTFDAFMQFLRDRGRFVELDKNPFYGFAPW